jgi:hypothetical protein
MPPNVNADPDPKHCFHLVTDILQKSNLYPVVINFVSNGPPYTFQTVLWSRGRSQWSPRGPVVQWSQIYTTLRGAGYRSGSTF